MGQSKELFVSSRSLAKKLGVWPLQGPEHKKPTPFHGPRGFDELGDWETELFDSGSLSSESAPQREGLPRNFKMRHAPHYVQELVSGGAVRQVVGVPVDSIDGATASPFGEGPSPTAPQERAVPPLPNGKGPAGATASPPEISALTKSIATWGILQPLLVRRHLGRYRLIAGASRLAAARRLGLREVPCVLYDVPPDQARQLLEATNQLAERNDGALPGNAFPVLFQSLQTIASCIRLLSDNGASPQDMAARLASAEAQRASRLAYGLSLLSLQPRLARSDIDAAHILDEVLARSSDERDLSRVTLEASVTRPCRFESDRRLVSVVMAGAIDALASVAGRGSILQLHLRRENDLVVFHVSQQVVEVGDWGESRWFDPAWRERPGGFAAGVALLAARRACELHGGRLELSAIEGGCQIVAHLPT